MARDKRILFTIGQFAALHGINKKTLMWYDEIGLFKPVSINEENGYRFYSYYQSTELETILLLRDMKVPVKDIQDFMKSRSAGNMAELLKDKIAELDCAIQDLKAVRSKLCSRYMDMPLRYNYDKPEKPRRIKGFEVFSLVFSSFSKPKNHTEISRIIGGVSLTTNE